MPEEPVARFYYYGISPWEIEVLYDTLKRSFEVDEKQLAPDDPAYVSMIEIAFPLHFDEGFFQAFTMESWFKIKGVIKDVKRRRGRKGLKAFIRFAGSPAITFPIAHKDDRRFEMALEKVEYLVDIVPVQLKSLPDGIEEVLFSFDDAAYKWSPSVARETDGKNYVFRSGEWKSR